MKKHSITPSQLVDKFKDKALEFAPGQKYSYTNSGYVLLGAIIEAISGASYEDFLRKNIFQPLKMSDTGVDSNRRVIERHAYGYARSFEDGYVNALYMDMTWPYAAGALYSTTQDLLRWDRALANESLISHDSTIGMFTPEKEGYAYGWVVNEKAGRTIVGHGGGTNGFCANIERIPSEKYCSVVLSNLDLTPVVLMAKNLRAIVFGDAYEIPRKFRAIKVAPAAYKAYLGRYEFDNFIFTITCENGRLMAQATGQPERLLLPLSESEFFIFEIYAQITFFKNENHQVTHLVLNHDGTNYYGKKP